VPLLAVVLLLFASSALRFRGIFLDPSFWGEDGTFFFRESVEVGPYAILLPVYGTYLTIPRLVAFLVSFFPTYWAPFSYALAAGLLSSLGLSLFSRAGYRWLVPDDRLRVLMCWLFSLVPGTYECYFALTPGIYTVFCGLFLLLLERDEHGRWQMGLGRALLVSFLWFSLGLGLVLAPLDSSALLRPVEEAKRAGIPTVIFDSALADPTQAVSYVSTDNGKGGRLAAKRMGDVLKGRGTVLMLRYQEGSAATEEREKGFLDELKASYPAITVTSSDQYAGATRDTAKRTSENLLNRYADRVDGIFTPNESSTAGMLLALQDIGKAGKIAFVGFDYSSAFIAPLERGELAGFVVQNPVNMGYLSVRTIVDHLQGRSVPPQVDTGVMMVTLDNLKAPDVAAVIHPPGAESQ